MLPEPAQLAAIWRAARARASGDMLDTRASYRYVRDVTCGCGTRVNAHEWLLEPSGGAVPVFGRGDACACAWAR